MIKIDSDKYVITIETPDGVDVFEASNAEAHLIYAFLEYCCESEVDDEG